MGVNNYLTTQLATMGLQKFFGNNIKAATAWAGAKNPYFENLRPREAVAAGKEVDLLNYVIEHMDHKVRARCLRYRSAR